MTECRQLFLAVSALLAASWPDASCVAASNDRSHPPVYALELGVAARISSGGGDLDFSPLGQTVSISGGETFGGRSTAGRLGARMDVSGLSVSVFRETEWRRIDVRGSAPEGVGIFGDPITLDFRARGRTRMTALSLEKVLVSRYDSRFGLGVFAGRAKIRVFERSSLTSPLFGTVEDPPDPDRDRFWRFGLSIAVQQGVTEHVYLRLESSLSADSGFFGQAAHSQVSAGLGISIGIRSGPWQRRKPSPPSLPESGGDTTPTWVLADAGGFLGSFNARINQSADGRPLEFRTRALFGGTGQSAGIAILRDLPSDLKQRLPAPLNRLRMSVRYAYFAGDSRLRVEVDESVLFRRDVALAPDADLRIHAVMLGLKLPVIETDSWGFEIGGGAGLANVTYDIANRSQDDNVFVSLAGQKLSAIAEANLAVYKNLGGFWRVGLESRFSFQVTALGLSVGRRF